MRCAACGHENRSGRRFCSACGAELGLACAACGADNEPGDRFCGSCGAALEARPPAAGPSSEPVGELRPVTVLFSDLTGFTELSNRLDPEATGSLLDAFFEIADGAIIRHGGTVDKHIGDCVMGLFGAPIAHADDASRAVTAAIEIRRGVGRLSEDRWLAGIGVHCGVANGTVMAASSGSTVRRDYTVIGPSVNLAARLCDAARTGEILVSGELLRLLAGQFDIESEGGIEISGFDEPVTVGRVRGPAKRVDRAVLPLVGRRRELRQVTGLIEECLEGRAGQAIFVRGEAGIGKTRLVEAIEDTALDQGFTAIKTRVLDFGAGRGQDTVRMLAEGFLFLLPGTQIGDVDAAIASAVAQGHIADEDRVFCAELLDLPVPADLAVFREQLAPDARRRRRAGLLGKLAGAASRNGPLLVVVEDIHWADAEVLAGLCAVAASIDALPAAVLMTGRPDADPVDHAFRLAVGRTPLATIDLGPLGEVDAAELARVASAEGASPVAEVVRRAEGNPLFLVQLAHHLGDLTTGALPATIQSLVFARLDRLDLADKAALQVASVLGNRFALDDLRRVAEVTRLDPTPLVAAYLLRPAGDAHEFAHALIREAVYESLPRSRRQALHRKAAEVFAGRDQLLQAEHLERAGDPAAAAIFLDVARDEMRLGNYGRALSLNGRGLAIAGEAADRYALSEQRGEICLVTGEVATARESFEAALSLASDDTSRCRAGIGIAQCLRITDELAAAEARLAEADDRARAAGLLVERSRIHHLRGNLLFPQGRLAECLAEHEAALELARGAGSIEAELAALGGIGDAASAMGRMLTARSTFARCVELARSSGFARVALANAPMLAIVEGLAGDIEGARRTAAEALQAAVRAGAVRPEMICHHARFIAMIEAGELAEARTEIERAEEIAASLGATRFQSENRAFLAWLLACEGKREEALRSAREGWELCKETARSYMGPVALGQIASVADDEAEREWAVAEAAEILEAGAVAHCYVFFYRALIEADILAGRTARAIRSADALDAATAGEPYPWASWVARWGRTMAGCLGEGPKPGIDDLRSLAEDGGRLGFLRLASQVPAG